MRERPNYDASLKRLLLRGAQGFVSLIAPGLVWLGELSPELALATRRADIVWVIALPDEQRAILHIELQTKADAAIGERVTEYGLQLWLRERLPVRSIVVFLRPTAALPTSPFVLHWLSEERLRYTYDVIRLWELPQERVLNTPYPELWPLAGLMADVTPDSTLAVADKIAATPLPPQEAYELEESLILFAGMRLPRTALRETLKRRKMLQDIWEASSLKDALADLYEERGMRRTIIAVLEARFGPLSPDILEAMEPKDEAALQELATRAGTDSLGQIRAWLGLA